MASSPPQDDPGQKKSRESEDGLGSKFGLKKKRSKQDAVGFQSVWRKEAEFLRCKRTEEYLNRVPKQRTAGLALSGGGIRSAAFALGVMQALNGKPQQSDREETPLFDDIDYISSVSGGGYAAAAVTWFRHLGASAKERGEVKAYEGLESFPRPHTAPRDGADFKAMQFIRSRKNHLTPTLMLNFVSMAAVALRTSLLSLPIFFAPLVVLMMLWGKLAEDFHWALFGIQWCELLAAHYIDKSAWLSLLIGGALLCLIGLGSVIFLLVSRFAKTFDLQGTVGSMFRHPHRQAQERVFEDQNEEKASKAPRPHWHYRFRRFSQKFLGGCLLLVTIFILIAFAMSLEPLIDRWATDTPLPVLLGGLIAGNGLGVLNFRSLLTGGQKKQQQRAKYIIICIAIFLLIGNLAAAYELAERLNEWLWDELPDEWPNWVIVAFSGIAGFIAAGFWANLNFVSLNRMYRDRLMETFMPEPEAFERGAGGGPAGRADQALLWRMKQRPYHIVNTHVVLTSSTTSKVRNRTGDNFVLSPLFCGSRATKYVLTRYFGAKWDTLTGAGGMTLATATAVSGAAFNPRVGPGGWDSPINNPIVYAMLSYYNLRLGCWVSNPARSKNSHPTFYQEGIKGVLNVGFHEKASMVELTDGGHFENTGLYELIQRRTDLIILSDATADRSFNFKDVGIAIERARADLGVEIRFSDSDWDLTHVMPNSQEGTHYDERYELAERGFAIASIEYPEVDESPLYSDVVGAKDEARVKQKAAGRKPGFLIYLKGVMTRRMPVDLYGYKGAHEGFPYQPITDQMFDESQFEAYRALGYHIASAMVDEAFDGIKKFLKEECDDLEVQAMNDA